VIRFVGFLGSLALYGFVAASLLFQVMIGDCDPAPVAHAQCEAARSNSLLGLATVSAIVVVLLVWIFLLRHRVQGKN